MDHPFLRGWVLDAADDAIVFDADENAPAVAVGERHYLLGQALIAEATAFEFGDVVFTVFENRR
jgi:hypothetical protein